MIDHRFINAFYIRQVVGAKVLSIIRSEITMEKWISILIVADTLQMLHDMDEVVFVIIRIGMKDLEFPYESTIHKQTHADQFFFRARKF